MNKVILEIGTEEIPSNYIDKALKDLKNSGKRELQKLRIKYGNIYTYGTPRRIVFYIEDIHSKQEGISQKIKGPAVNISFDKEGNPLKPAIGFAQSHQLEPEELLTESTEKGDYLFVNKVIKGQETESLLPEFLLKLIMNLQFPKSMRWGIHTFYFIRPIRWLLALYDENTIPFQLETLQSGNMTYGQQLVSPKQIKITSVNHYFEIMKSNSIIIDPEERKKTIQEMIGNLINKNHWKDSINAVLLDEVKNLVEYPQVLLGEFNKDYLELPTEVLKAVMIKHQKYFPIYDEKDQLLPYFFIVINGKKDKFEKMIITGNERVLKARLEDAKFFYQEDQKVGDVKLGPLDENIEKLKKVLYQKNLGSMYDKVTRLIKLAEKIGEELCLGNDLLKTLKRSAMLCKSDLVSEIVKEFPELQGIMGKEYALLQKENEKVATTIFEHYLPRFSGDILPQTITGSLLSITDKMDNIVSCFLNNMIPDGSQDPYALRRQSLGILNIILYQGIDFSLDVMIDFNLKLLMDGSVVGIQGKTRRDKSIQYEVKDFILQRFRYLLLEKGYRYDVLDAVLTKNPKSITDILQRVKVLQENYQLPRFNKIITTSTRTLNLSKNAESSEINCSIFREKEEKKLYQEYQTTKEKIKKAFDQQNYEKIFNYLEDMTGPIDQFFDHILVMEKDETIRNNRLALLKAITEMYHTTADLSKIAVAKGNF